MYHTKRAYMYECNVEINPIETSCPKKEGVHQGDELDLNQTGPKLKLCSNRLTIRIAHLRCPVVFAKYCQGCLSLGRRESLKLEGVSAVGLGRLLAGRCDVHIVTLSRKPPLSELNSNRQGRVLRLL